MLCNYVDVCDCHVQEAEASALSRLSSELSSPHNHENRQAGDPSSPHDITHAADVDEELHSTSALHLESSIMATRSEAELEREASGSQRGSLYRSPSASSGDEAIGFTSKRSLQSDEGSVGEDAATAGLAARKVQRVAATSERLLKLDAASDHAPVRKARVSVRTRLDSTTVSPCMAQLSFSTLN